MTARDLEGILRAGDPEELAWVPPDFEQIRARAAAEPVIRQARPAPPRRIVALFTIAAAALAIVVAAIALAPQPPPVGSSPSPTATSGPSLSVTDRAAVAGAMGVPPEQVVPTEDGAVAVRLAGSTLAVLVATRDPANAGGWTVSTLVTDTGFSPGGNGVDAAVCITRQLVRSVFVFGQLSQSGVAGPLQLVGLPVAQAADTLGGQLVNGLYVFALQGPVAPGSLLTVTGPGAPQIHGAPGHPSFEGWAQISIPEAQPCEGVSPSPAASALSPDASAALATAEAYESARAAGHWSTAWALLSGYSQVQAGSLAAYEANETAYNRSGGTRYTIEPPTRDSDLLGVAFLGDAYSDAAAHVQIGRAWLVVVVHPDVPAASAGTVSLLIAPEGDQSLVWIAH